jgi:hypothetical protein
MGFGRDFAEKRSAKGGREGNVVDIRSMGRLRQSILQFVENREG